MRCQKVRFYLSAFCRDELPDGRRKAVAAHLQNCSECRAEVAVFYELIDASQRITDYGVGADFNSGLLDRIATERFKETRSKAYFPKRIPIVSWGRVVPVLATACLIVAFVVTGGIDTILHNQMDEQTANIPPTSTPVGDNYLTVQPQPDHINVQPAAVSSGTQEWRFKQEMAKVNRVRGLIMSSFAGQRSQPFPGMLDDGFFLSGLRSRQFTGAPFQLQPIQEQVVNGSLPETLNVKETRQTY